MQTSGGKPLYNALIFIVGEVVVVLPARGGECCLERPYLAHVLFRKTYYNTIWKVYCYDVFIATLEVISPWRRH